MRRYSLTVRGKRKIWAFTIDAEPAHVEDWRADGLQVDELLNSIPAWWVNMGLPVGLWCFLEDVWNLKFYKKDK
jgi:hypothetical protein